MYTVSRYDPANKLQWDSFVSASPTGHFMFRRDYMDYHSDRFEDHSLLIHEKGKLVALLPANAVGGELHSHQGLTFGGLIVGPKVLSSASVAITQAVTRHIGEAGFSRAVIKAMPAAFCETAREDLLYGLHHNGWTLFRRDLSSVIDYAANVPYRSSRRRAVQRAREAGMTINSQPDLAQLWAVLSEVLAERHEAAPTHNLDEITTLAERFPNNIRPLTIEYEGRVLGGTVMFLQAQAAHTQYLCVNAEGRSFGGLDFLLDAVITRYREAHRWFSFGISTTEAGEVLNDSLIFHKESFGARGLVHDFYEYRP